MSVFHIWILLTPRKLIYHHRHWIYPKKYVVADTLQLHKLLLNSQLSSSKTYDCSVLVVKQASEKDITSIRSILEQPTCRMRGLRNLKHIAFGKVTMKRFSFRSIITDFCVDLCRRSLRSTFCDRGFVGILVHFYESPPFLQA